MCGEMRIPAALDEPFAGIVRILAALDEPSAEIVPVECSNVR